MARRRSESARFGESADDWILLTATSGPHTALVLEVISETTTSPQTLRAECETHDAAFIADDLRHAPQQSDAPSWMPQRIRDLERLITGRRWRQPAR